MAKRDAALHDACGPSLATSSRVCAQSASKRLEPWPLSLIAQCRRRDLHVLPLFLASSLGPDWQIPPAAARTRSNSCAAIPQPCREDHSGCFSTVQFMSHLNLPLTIIPGGQNRTKPALMLRLLPQHYADLHLGRQSLRHRSTDDHIHSTPRLRRHTDLLLLMGKHRWNLTRYTEWQYSGCRYRFVVLASELLQSQLVSRIRCADRWSLLPRCVPRWLGRLVIMGE